MIIEMITTKYRLYKNGNEYVLTTRKGAEITRGTKKDCMEFINNNQYGVVSTKEDKEMTREFAIAFLMDQGWNRAGAEVIVDTAIEGGTFEQMTTTELKDLSDDYIDR